MTRKEFEALIFDTYNVRADYPFEDDLMTGVFRHTDTEKWFALAMNISAKKLGKTIFRIYLINWNLFNHLVKFCL